MIKSLLVASVVRVGGCGGHIPQRPVSLLSSSQPVFLTDLDKNKAARRFVEQIRSEYGSSAILSIGAIGPRGYHFEEVVRSFGRRAAVAYTEQSPSLWVHFDLSFIDGWLKTPEIRNFVLRTSLFRAQSVNLGSEVLYRSIQNGKCTTSSEALRAIQCRVLIQRLAEESLYNLNAVSP